jgi:hypothetical protein
MLSSLVAKVMAVGVLAGGGAVGQYKGYVSTNAFLQTRLLDASDERTATFQLARYFGESYLAPGGLWSLLGAFSGQGTANAFRNGTPNGLNMLLWDIGFTRLGRDIGTICQWGGDQLLPFKLNDAILADVLGLCTAGGDEGARRTHLGRLWMDLLGFDLPEEEMAAFVDFFSTDAAYLALAPDAQVAQAMTALLMHPLVLLEN